MKGGLFLFVLLVGCSSTENHSPVSELVDTAVSLLKEGLTTYPHVNLHLSLPPHEDLNRMESWLRETVPSLVEEFLKEMVSSCTSLVATKKATLEALQSLVKNAVENEVLTFQLKKNLTTLTSVMIQEMNEDKGSIDFEMDSVARTGLGFIYFHVKSKVSSLNGNLIQCPENCGISHPPLMRALSLLKSWEPETVSQVLNILLGAPGLETRFVRPQLVTLKKSYLLGVQNQDFEFLVSLGEWLNDVLNAGLVVMHRTLGEIRGHLVEILGSTKDDLVPKLQVTLEDLENRKEELGIVLEMFNTVIRKYLGNF